jgi:putative RecB family exonuclease
MNEMDIDELRKQPHLSASSINDYCDCSLQYKFGRIDKLPQESKSSAMLFGSCIHKSLSDFHLERMMGGKFTLQDFHNNFETHWIETVEGEDDIKYRKGKDFETLLQEGKDLLTAYHDNLPDDQFTVLALEEPFSFNLPGLPVPIIGVYDLVQEDEDGTIIIVEFKTSKQSYSQDKIDKSLQLTLYQMAAKANGYYDREILLRFDTLIKTKTPKFEQYYTVRSAEDERRAIKKVIQVWDGISKEVFIPNYDGNWKCGGCSYRSACNEWFEK